MVTQQGDWLFNADNYFKWSPGEDWGMIPPGQRDSRDTLVAAANAYLDAFLEKKLDLVPWGYPCNRTEGGIRTGKGVPEDSCQVGVPAGVNIVARRFVVDESDGSGCRVLYFRCRRIAGYSPFSRREGQAAFRAYPDARASGLSSSSRAGARAQ